jgi:flagellar motility protein MotE (MotC chaperone)
MSEILAALLLAASSSATAPAAKPASAETRPVDGKRSLSIDPQPAHGAAERPTLPPEITADGLRDELRRAARERKLQAAKLSDERAKLTDERGQLEQMARDIEGARQSLRAETQDLRQQIKKRPQGTSTSPAEAAGGGTPDGAKPPPGPLDLVAKTLKNMKPDQAAQVLMHVERSLAVGVLGRMRPSDAGAVLEKMKPEQAAQFVAALAGEGHGDGREQRHE